MMLLIILNFLYACMFVTAKFALQTSQPIFLTATRLFIGGFICLTLYSMTDSGEGVVIFARVKKSEWILLGLMSFINIYAANCLEIWAMQYLSVGKTAFIYNLTPFFSALLAYFLFSEKMTLQKWIGLSIGFMGFVPVFCRSSNLLDTTYSFGFITVADCALIGAALSAVFGWTLVRILVRDHRMPIFFVNGISLLVGSAFCFLHAFIYEHKPFVYNGMFWQFITVVVAMGLVKYAFAYNLNSFLLMRYSTTLTAFFSFTSSLFTTVLGIYFFQEKVTWTFLFSIVTVFFGLLIFYQEELRQGYISK
ncbi:MAG: DMT family transporter [Candidatus Chromulinivorax sp.]